MNLGREWKIGGGIAAIFLAIYFLPVGLPRFDGAVQEALYLVKWYAREHVILCLLPAFFIAGAIGTFVRQASVMKYLGAGANRVTAYGVASVSGSILAVCSCTVLPLFAGIYRMGAGLGPASAFLYSGPAINVLAMILTARVLGFEIGAARAIGAVAFALVIGVVMHAVFRHEDAKRIAAQSALPESGPARPLAQTALFFTALVGILIFANWAPAAESPFWMFIYQLKWWITSGLLLSLAVMLAKWFTPDERREWLASTWDFAKQILPLLFIGVLASGFLLGRPGHEGIIPSAWIAGSVSGNSLAANLFASVVGALMYFATLTEVPIVQGLIGSGMGNGPALALLLAGPALSLPSMLVIRTILGTKKTVVYVSLVVVMSTITGLLYGTFFS